MSEELEARGGDVNRPTPQRQQPADKKRARAETFEQTSASKQSLWPFALAVALVVVLVGVITSPVILGIGVLLLVAAAIGWGLEQR